eukprot:6206763-Pleurochrysis_carterae.AAC.8
MHSSDSPSNAGALRSATRLRSVLFGKRVRRAARGSCPVLRRDDASIDWSCCVASGSAVLHSAQLDEHYIVYIHPHDRAASLNAVRWCDDRHRIAAAGAMARPTLRPPPAQGRANKFLGGFLGFFVFAVIFHSMRAVEQGQITEDELKIFKKQRKEAEQQE